MSDENNSDFEIDEDFLRDAFGENDEQGTRKPNTVSIPKKLEQRSGAHVVDIQPSAYYKNDNTMRHGPFQSVNTSEMDHPMSAATSYNGDGRNCLVRESAVEREAYSNTLLAPKNIRNAESVLATPKVKKTSARRRKIPGPAGLLPDKIYDRTLDSSILNESRPEVSPPEEDVCSQNSVNEIDNSPWLRLRDNFDQSQHPRLSFYNVKWIKRLASAKLFVGSKVPFLAVVIKSIDFYSTDPSVVLQDSTGEMSGTLHRNILEKYPSHLKPGTALVLHRLGVVSTGFPVKRHYLNITLNNLISIYDKDEETESDQVRVTSIKNISMAEIMDDIKVSEEQSQNMSTSEHRTFIQEQMPLNSRINTPNTSTSLNFRRTSTPAAADRTTNKTRAFNEFDTEIADCVLFPNSSRHFSAHVPVSRAQEDTGQSVNSPADRSKVPSKVARLSESSVEPTGLSSTFGENSSLQTADAEVVENIFKGFDCSSLFEDF